MIRSIREVIQPWMRRCGRNIVVPPQRYEGRVHTWLHSKSGILVIPYVVTIEGGDAVAS